MGNTPSSEDPRRPQKLFKLQLGSQALEAGPHHILNQLETHHGRSSNSYLVGSGSSPDSSPIEPSDPSVGIATTGDDFEHATPPIPRRNSRRDSRLWSIVSRTHSFKSDHTRSRSMTAPTSRPRSFIGDSEALPSHGESLHTIRHCSSANLNARTHEAQQLQIDESTMSTPENQFPTCDVTENTWKSSHPTYDARSIPRSNSDASIYMPTRRRSIVQTPGVATRAHPSTLTASGRSKSRNSLLTPSQTRHESIESTAFPNLTIPPIKFGSHPPERVVTPCEAEYKQLGGMKFGSLRITNGSPKLSPRIEKDNSMEVGLTSTVVYSVDHESLSSTMAKRSGERNGSLSGNGIRLEYAVPEILHVRDDPNAKPTAEKIRLELESKTLKNLNRSDSGFISSPSSEDSRKAVSKTDSGYSSNVSLSSFQSLRSAVTDIGRKSPEKEQDPALSNTSPKNTGLRSAPVASSKDATTRYPETRRRPGTTPIVVRPSDVTPTKSSSHRSLSSMAREGLIKMPSLTASGNHESQLPTSRPRSSPAQTQHHIVQSSSCPPTPVLSQDPHRITHVGRTERMPSTSQRKGPPKVRNNRTANKTIQRSRSDITQRSTDNNKVYVNDSRRPMLHDDKSKETLRTIMSMGSTDVLQNAQGRQSVKAHEAAKQDTAEPTTPKTSRRGSFRARAKSITQAATTLLISGKSPVTKMSKSTDTGSPRCKTEVANHSPIQHGKESRVTSQTERGFANTVKPALPKTPDHHAARRNSLPALPGSRSSLLESNSAPYRVKKTRTPPPVSMQTRSGKKTRGQGLAHSQSAPSPAELAHLRQVLVPREVRRDMIQSYPQAQGAPAFYGHPSYNQVVSLNQQQLAYLQGHRTPSWHAGSGSQSPLPVAQAGHQRRGSAPTPQGHHGHTRVRSRSGSAISQQQLGRLSPQVQPMYGGNHTGQQWLQPHPTQFHGQVHVMDAMMHQDLDRHVVPNPQPVHSRHRRAVSQGATYNQNPPFRVLHSYNSPAYRGAPIWG
ncbi:hypothetical protein B0J13DRAFT_172214 [Dactylonectria estremocensis]|uniref:Uncharacterized protein n=1 Tax=Dactylonectria estremocensis TaxID=1079267 RepID=A0A9P9JB28_9HYPO|nr:hypothetical protein B0J13DRAFT_172214 [Dactylonectria estremocensis]